MQLLFPHQLTYHPRQILTPTEIANNLIAQERLIYRSARFLEFALPGLTVERIEIDVRHIESGSLYEEFLVSFWTTFQKDLSKEVTDIIQASTGIDVPEQYDSLVTLGVLCLALAGGIYVYKRVFPGETGGLQIRGNYNTVVQVTAERLNITPG